MKNLFLLMIVSMFAVSFAYAEGEDMASTDGMDCGDRIEQALEVEDGASNESSSGSSVRSEG